MFDVITRYPWFGIFGQPRFYLIHRNRAGFSIINEYNTREDAKKGLEAVGG